MPNLTPPPLPAWDGLHPLIVHFPIALLLIVPLFVLLGLVPRVGPGFRLAALVLMILGTVAAFVAVETGEAAGQLVIRNEQIDPVLQAHAELAETVRNVYTGLSALYLLGLLVPAVLRKTGRLKQALPWPVPVLATVVFVALWGAANLLLANVGHLGGRLVHEFGVQAIM
jgi:uncharacterized membrane protein